MKRLDPAIRTVRSSRWLLLAAALLVGAACQGAREEGAAPRAQRPRPTPAPPFTSFDRAGRAELIAYAHSLQFDTTRPAQDAQYLVVPHAGQLAVGTYAEVAAEIGSGTIDRRDLQQGRILARLVLDGPCPEAGYPRGVSYLWVDSTAGALREVLVSEMDSVPLKELRLEVRTAVETGGPNWLRPSAWFDVLRALADSQRMIICHTCDFTICCGASLMSDLAALRAPRVPGAPPLRR